MTDKTILEQIRDELITIRKLLEIQEERVQDQIKASQIFMRPKPIVPDKKKFMGK